MLPQLKQLISKKGSSLTAPVSDSQLMQAVEDASDTSRPIAIGAALLVGAFLVFVLWACFAPLDEGVPASGMVAVESRRKVVQHMTGGVIRKILVKEAQEVTPGEPLIQLDDTTQKANYDAARQQYFALQATADRLHAESVRADRITFSPALLSAAEDSAAVENMNIQKQLFVTRRNALQGDLAILEAAQRSAEEQIQGLEAQARGKQQQLRFVQEQLAGSRELAREGYLPRNRLFEEERLAADLQASSTELQSTVLRARSNAIEAKQRAAQRLRDYQKEVETQYSDYRREAMLAAERMRSTKEEFARTVIRSPVDGYVNGLAAMTEGGVVTPGARLMDIVPKDEALILEVNVDPNVIDRVYAGLPVNVSVHAFVNDPNLLLDGVVESVSADIVSDSRPNVPPHYLARVRVTPEGMRELGSRVLQPGMPVQVMIKTGERTLMQYMLKPLLMRLNSAMKEN